MGKEMSMYNVVSVIFEVESEAYQAFTEMRNHGADPSFEVNEAALLKAEDKQLQVVDLFDTGVRTADDTAYGMLIGTLVGIIGGPIGMLFGASVGALTGSVLDASDAGTDISILEYVADKLYDDEVAIVALVNEAEDSSLDSLFDKYGCTIIRHDAEVVASDIEHANQIQADLEHQARAQMRAQKKADIKAKLEERGEQLEEGFKEYKAEAEAAVDQYFK